MAKQPKPPTVWTKVVEDYGVRVRLFERRGMIYHDVTLGRTVSARGKARTRHDVKSMGHSDRKLAVQQAKVLAARIAEARLTGVAHGSLTLGNLFGAYRMHRLPALKPTRKREAEAQMARCTAS